MYMYVIQILVWHDMHRFWDISPNWYKMVKFNFYDIESAL